MRILKIALLALSGLRRTPLRVALTALGVAIASGALVSMVGFALGMQKQVEAPIAMLGLFNNVIVSPKKAEKGTDPPVLDDNALARMQAIPGVTLAYPEIQMRDIKLTYGAKSETAFAMAVPRQVAMFGSAQNMIVAGRLFTEGDRPETILGERLAQDLGFSKIEDIVGKKVTLQAGGLSLTGSETFTFERKELAVTVVGVYRLPQMMPKLVDRAILLPVELMKQIPGVHFSSSLQRMRAGAKVETPGYGQANLRVAHFSDLTPVKKAVEKMGFRAKVLADDLAELRQLFVFLDLLLSAVGTVALVVAALGIVNTLLMAVLERYQEIGIYKTIGASDGDVLVLFLTEAGMIGLLGGAGGLVLGRLVSWGLAVAANSYARSQGLEKPLELFNFPLWLLAATMVFAVVVSVLAGIYPAMRASRVDPIRALRHG